MIEMKVDQWDTLSVSLSLQCYHQIEKQGALEAAQAAFGSWLQPEAHTGYDITVTVTKSDWTGKENSIIDTLSNMKGIVLGGVFEKYYSALQKVIT